MGGAAAGKGREEAVVTQDTRRHAFERIHVRCENGFVARGHSVLDAFENVLNHPQSQIEREIFAFRTSDLVTQFGFITMPENPRVKSWSRSHRSRPRDGD